MTTSAITREQILDLLREATQASDFEMTSIALRALVMGRGSREWAQCVDVIEDARAMDDDR